MPGSEATSGGSGIVSPDESAQSRILVVEDHELLAQSVGFALSHDGHAVHTSVLTSMADVVRGAEAFRPDVVLLDLDLGEGVGDGVALVAPLHAVGARVLVVTASTERHRLGHCLEEGAVGVLSKRAPFDDLLRAVRTVADGHSPLAEGERLQLLRALREWRATQIELYAPFERLTPKERQVLSALIEGMAAESMARDWVVSETTVRTQIRGVLTKLGVSSQLAAVAQARRANWHLDRAC
jgi:DNA-binding NarL/FixJ family response regulator